jgi:hypothetical protein
MGLKAVTSGQANITSGTVLVDAGSATAPPVGFAADSDGTGTGLYRFGADSPAITCNGTGAWRWGSTGTYLPITDNAVDVGTSSIRPRDVFIARTLQVGQAVAVTAGGATTGFVGISSTANLKNGLTPTEEKKILEEARRRMKYALEADSDDRKRAEGELKFVWNKDNCQWDDEAKKIRAKRPMLTENRNPAFIRRRPTRCAARARRSACCRWTGRATSTPRSIYEGLIRNIEANSRADLSYDGRPTSRASAAAATGRSRPSTRATASSRTS